MRIGIPIYHSRVSPVFDFSHRLVIAEGDKEGMKKSRKEIILSGLEFHERAKTLKEAGIEIIICAGISGMLMKELFSLGIEVLSGIVGDVEEVLVAYEQGKLNESRFFMPGGYLQRWRQEEE
ncbi:MAG: NifB/NifX family molybdenum-iron cluster-binding protein [bacterium]